jgi:hypothetical protein
MRKPLRKSKRTREITTVSTSSPEPSKSLFGSWLSHLSDHKRERFKYYLAASVSLITFSVYLTSLRNDFVIWDDDTYVFDNPYIRSFDLNLFKWAFFDFYAANWHPLTWISHALDYAVWGLDPMGHHLTNNILHAVNTFLVVLLVVRLLEVVNALSLLNSPRPPLKIRGGAEGGGVISIGGFSDKGTLIAAATTGLLFGLHPLHVESVAWVAERKDLLCAFFFLLSIMMYARHLTPPSPSYFKRGWRSRGSYLLSLLFFTLALLSKPMAMSLPLVLLILDWYPFENIRSLKTFLNAVINKAPFIALSIASSILTIVAQKAGGTMELMEFVPLSARLLVASNALIAYLYKVILPFNLTPYYPYPEKVLLLTLEYFLPLILIIGISATCIVFVKKQRVWLSVWVYYIVSLIPVLGIVQVGKQAMADRYTYLPSLGPFLIVGLIVAWGLTKVGAFKKWGLFLRLLSAVMAISIFISISYLTFEQISIWKNTLSLWTYVIEKEPERVPIAYMNRGKVYYQMGQLNKAMEDYDKAVTLKPFDSNYYHNRGLIFAEMRQFDKAIADYDHALALDQRGAENFVGRPFCFLARGLAYLAIGQRVLAVSDLKRACELGNNIGCNELQILLKNGF